MTVTVQTPVIPTYTLTPEEPTHRTQPAIPQPAPKNSIFAKIWAYIFGSKPSSSQETALPHEKHYQCSCVQQPIRQAGWYMWLKSFFGF